MSAEANADVELEIAHILFIDSVGYSKLLIDEQRELLARLNHIVRDSQCFRAADAAGKLIRLPTGDGMALVFSDDPEAPIRCALEIQEAARDHLPLRMGIHSGPVSRVVDVNDRVNIAGSGINTAQRVMNCGDGGHILLSKRTADDLADYGKWRPFLHPLGECEVKHGVTLSLVNLYMDKLGNPEIPVRLKEAVEKRLAEESARRVVLRRRLAMASVVALSFVAVALAGYVAFHRTKIVPGIPEKSIAVLPFEYMADDQQYPVLADMIVEEIQTDLKNIATLDKITSWTSAMQYKAGLERNLGEIARTLGVAHILEGTVQRQGTRLKVNAQLIDARNDAHIWAHVYELDIADLFVAETKLAKEIASQLKLTLSPEEKEAIEKKPTEDVIADELYINAQILHSASVYTKGKENRLEAAALLDQAIARDPGFFAAYCQLVRIHSELYLLGMDHTPTRLALADAALHVAQRLQPDAGETHLASAIRLYCSLDYTRAREEILKAQGLLHNEPLVFEFSGFIDRRQGHWNDAARNLERALELDPLNFYFLQQMSQSYEKLRRFDDMAAIMRRALAVVPNDPGAQIHLAEAELFSHANTAPLRSTLTEIVKKDPQMEPFVAVDTIHVALCERDYPAAEKALAAMPARGGTEESFLFPRSWYAGLIARTKGDRSGERTAFISTKAELEQIVREQVSYPQPRCVLGMVEAALGDKDAAMRQGREAVDMLPMSRDAINGALMIEYLAVTYAWCGEKDKAIEQLKIVANIPSDVSYGKLKLHPFWDSIRDDPRFQEIVASLAPR